MVVRTRPTMKGRGVFRALHVAARALLSAQMPLSPSKQALYEFNSTCPRSSRSPCLTNFHIFHPRASLNTAAERVAPIASGKDKEGLTTQNPTGVQQESSEAASEYVGLPATTKDQKPRVVVLGSGWAACRLLKDLNTSIYDIVCIAPRNHMVFTPLLASTCVGTLEFRSVAEPVRQIQPALAKSPNSFFFLAQCTDVDSANREVHCESIVDEHTGVTGGDRFRVSYDKLVIATGAEATTFGIDGVHKHAIFLRDVKNAMDIRSKLMLNLALCEIPGKTLKQKKRLLHCVVVGGGPTGVEFSGELSDFIMRDVTRKFAHVRDLIQVTLIEAKEILSSFDVRLREYATKQLRSSGVQLKRGMVKHVLPEKLILSDGSEVPYGLLVWSTGVGASAFVQKLESFEKSKTGKVGIDEHLRVPRHDDVYALGDCAGYIDSLGKPPLPALAQVAERQGKYLAKTLNKLGKMGHARRGRGAPPVVDPFVYKHLGSMATVGRYKALVDLREAPDAGGYSMTGFKSWLIWRSAYLTRSISWRARLYVAFNWATTFLFGRDISRF